MHTVCLVIMRILLKTSLENMHTEIGDVFWFHLWEAVSFQDPSMGMGTNHQYQITSLPFLRLNIEEKANFLLGCSSQPAQDLSWCTVFTGSHPNPSHPSVMNQEAK